MEPTMEKLKMLKLEALAVAWIEQQKNPEVQKLAFDERLGMLVDAQWMARENKRLARALSSTTPPQTTMASAAKSRMAGGLDFQFGFARSLW